MSSQYNTFYEMAHVPCSSAEDQAALEAGTAQVNVDGQAIYGGFNIEGNKLAGGSVSKGGTYKAGNQHIIYMGGFGARYAVNRNAAASNVHTVRAARATHL